MTTENPEQPSTKAALDSIAAAETEHATVLSNALSSIGELADLELGAANQRADDAEGALEVCGSERTRLESELGTAQLQVTQLTTENATLTERRDYWRRLYRQCSAGEEPEPAPPRFPSDPGIDRVVYGWDVEGQLSKYMGAEITKIGSLVGHDIVPAWAHKYSQVGENLFGTGGDARWAAQRGMNVYLNYEVGNPTNADRLLAGDYDPWIRQQAVSIIEMGELYGIVVAFACSNEPDNPAEPWNDTAVGRRKLRQCALYIARKFAELGVTNQFMTTPSYIPQTFHSSQWRAENGQDWWGEYHPLLLDDVDPREWDSVFTPPREAFSDEFFCMICTNQYDWHPMNGALKYDPERAMWSPAWTHERYLKHTPLDDSDGKHMKLCDTVAKSLGAPIMIGEFGWFPFEKKTTGTELDISLQLIEKIHRQLADDSEVAIVMWWKQVLAGTDAQVRTSAQAFGGRMQQASSNNGEKGQPDPNDARRKMVAKCFELSEADAA